MPFCFAKTGGRPSGLTETQRARRSGQALLESFGMIILLCVLLFGVVQYVLMLTAKEVVQFGADAAVRARTVGLNEFMTYKVSRVATIPNAGIMTAPGPIAVGNAATWAGQGQGRVGRSFHNAIRSRPTSAQYQQVERYNIPLYLGATDFGQLGGYLDYEDWETVGFPAYVDDPGASVGVRLEQDYPLRMPFLRAFWRNDELPLEGRADLADHADLYLE